MSQPTLKVRIAPSGQGFAFEAFGPDGVSPTAITGFAGLDESQALTVTGLPQAQGVTLGYGPAAIGPIPFRRVPTAVSSSFPIALPGPGVYDLWACVVSYACAANVFDGVLPAIPVAPGPIAPASTAYPAPQAIALDPASPPTGTYTDPGGAVFLPLGRFSFATSSAVVEVYAPAAGNFDPSAVRVVPAGGGAAIVMDTTSASNTVYDGLLYPDKESGLSTNRSGYYGSGFRTYSASQFIPTSWYLDPADVAAAFQASPAFAGGVKATSAFYIGTPTIGSPTPTIPHTINLAFSGPAGGVAIGPPTFSDPSVSGAILHPGGQPIRWTRAGVTTPIDPAGSSFTRQGFGDEPFFHVPLPQSDVYPGTIGGAYIATADGYTFTIQGQQIPGTGVDGESYTGLSTYLAYGLGGSVLTFPLEGLPAATYSLEITWPLLSPTAFANQNWGGPCASATVTVLDRSGAVLHAETVDQTKPPVGPADPARPGVSWHSLGSFVGAGVENRLHVVITNTAGVGVTIADAVRITRTSPDTSIRIAPTDVVTFDAPPGAIQTGAGPSPALVGYVAGHAAGSLLPDPALVTPKMTVGWNATGDAVYSMNLGHSNLCKRITTGPSYPGDHGLPGFLAVDANLYPTSLSIPVAIMPVVGRAGDGEAAGPGIPAIPNDAAQTWSVWWDDASGGQAPAPGLVDANGTPFPEVALPTTVKGQAVGNRRYFNGVHDARASAPAVQLALPGNARAADGTYPCTIKNLAIYPPDPATGGAWANPPVWHPSFTARLGIGPIRCLDLTGAAASNSVESSDAAQPGWFSFGNSPQRAVGIASIRQDANADGFFNGQVGAVIRITTATPHGLSEMQTVSLTPGSSGTIGHAAFTFNGGPLITDYSNGQPYDPPSYFDDQTPPVHVLSATEFSIITGFNRSLKLAGATASSFAMSNVLTPTAATTPPAATAATVVLGGNPGVPYADVVALGVESGQPIWLPIPALASDAWMTEIAHQCLAQPVGRKLYLEYCNETWNSGVIERAVFELLSPGLKLSTAAYDYAASYVYKMKHCHDLFESVFAAAGRGGEIVRVCGSCGANPGTTRSVAGYSVLYNAPIDLLAVGAYLDCCPPDATFGNVPPATLDRLNIYTIEQDCDLRELAIEYGPLRTLFDGHFQGLVAAGAKRSDGSPTGVAVYEGGIQTLMAGISGYSQTPNATNPWLRTLAGIRHPRMYRLARRVAELAQAGKCELFLDYHTGTTLDLITWAKFEGTYRPYGTGDPTKDTANFAPFTPKAAVALQIPAAYRDWAQATLPNAPAKGRIPFHFFFQNAGGI